MNQDRRDSDSTITTNLETAKLCAEAMGLRVFTDAYGALCIEHLDILSTDNEVYDPLTRPEQAWALADRFPSLASSVFASIAISRHDHDPDPRNTNAASLLVESVAARQRNRT